MNQTLPLERLCCGCGATKSAQEFGTVTKKETIRLQSRCILCRRLDAKRYYHSLSKDEKVRRKRKGTLLSYGLSQYDYDSMVLAQGGRCKTCNKLPTYNLYVDHDHACCSVNRSCGQCVRGLLCFECNSALGLIKEEIGTLNKMSDYLGFKVLTPDE